MMTRTLEEQREEYKRRRFIAMPIAGMVMWALIGIAGAVLPEQVAALCLFIGTGSILYLGLFVSKFTGENYMDRSRPKNAFDSLFLQTVAMALLVFSIAIPFYMLVPSSLPLSVGILTGLMWLPLSWAIGHWVGIFHSVSRTLLIVLFWYLLPEYRFATIPAVIVVIYALTLVVLEKRYRRVNHLDGE